jgi:hypothetical protein
MKCSPPPFTIPFTAVITGFQQRLWIAVSLISGESSYEDVLLARGVARGDLGHVEAGAERLVACARDDHADHRGIALDLGPRFAELARHRDVERRCGARGGSA